MFIFMNIHVYVHECSCYAHIFPISFEIESDAQTLSSLEARGIALK